MNTIFSRTWAMPNGDTFSVPPIGEFVKRYLKDSTVSVDPFARNKRWATHTNDLSPITEAEHHMDAEEFLKMLAEQGVRADLVIFDPPYSPRQISECYKSVGREVGMKETQSALLYQRVRNAIVPILADGGIVLSFGWNTVGMGKKHGFEQVEILLCCHGGAHNDTICLAERMNNQNHKPEHAMKNNQTDKWTVITRESSRPIPNSDREEKCFTHFLRYDGKKVHNLTGDNGLKILTDTAREFNEQGYEPIFNSTVLLHELSGSQRKKLDDLCAKSVPDLFPVESEVVK